MANQFEIAELPYVTRRHFLEIANSGSQWDFNRQLDPEAIRSLPNDENCVYPVVMALIHQHRRMVRCEDHIRLLVQTPQSLEICDVPMDYAESLPLSIRVQVNGKLIVALLLDESGKPLSLRYRSMTRMVRKAIQHLAKKNHRIKAFVTSQLSGAAA